jgi:hypothetical protein
MTRETKTKHVLLSDQLLLCTSTTRAEPLKCKLMQHLVLVFLYVIKLPQVLILYASTYV